MKKIIAFAIAIIGMVVIISGCAHFEENTNNYDKVIVKVYTLKT